MYLSTTEFAETLGVTYRRLRQLIEQGYSKEAPKRGECHAPWMLHLLTGLQMASDRSIKLSAKDAPLAVCISWIIGIPGIPGEGEPSKEDIEILAESFKREGYSRDDCLMTLGRAKEWWAKRK